jgi:hypothetical protein
MVSLGWFNELRETGSVLTPVELSAVNDYTTDCGAVATNPLCSAVNDNIGAVVDGTDEVTTSSEGVVNLNIRKCFTVAVF